jgi:hypothetical protein
VISYDHEKQVVLRRKCFRSKLFKMFSFCGVLRDVEVRGSYANTSKSITPRLPHPSHYTQHQRTSIFFSNPTNSLLLRQHQEFFHYGRQQRKKGVETENHDDWATCRTEPRSWRLNTRLRRYAYSIGTSTRRVSPHISFDEQKPALWRELRTRGARARRFRGGSLTIPGGKFPPVNIAD